MRVYLFAGLLEIALGVAFLAAPLPRAEIQKIETGDANTGVQTTRSGRVSPIVSFVLLASGITLTVTGISRRRKPEQLSYTASPISREAPGNTTP